MRKERELNAIRTLDAQCQERNQQKAVIHGEHAEERCANEQKLRELKAAEEQQKMDKRKKQMELRHDLDMQATGNQQKRQQFEEMELAIEKKQAELIRNELELARIEAENDKVFTIYIRFDSDTNSFVPLQRHQREETDKFLEYMRTSRRASARAEADRDQVIDDIRRKLNEEAHRQRQELMRHKRDMERETYAAMWKRINENQQRSLAEAERRAKEAKDLEEVLRQNAMAEREAAEQRRRNELEYGRELKYQEELTQKMRVSLLAQLTTLLFYKFHFRFQCSI